MAKYGGWFDVMPHLLGQSIKASTTTSTGRPAATSGAATRKRVLWPPELMWRPHHSHVVGVELAARARDEEPANVILPHVADLLGRSGDPL
jgi:hypothetical protein